jgi:hypothetical protein
MPTHETRARGGRIECGSVGRTREDPSFARVYK